MKKKIDRVLFFFQDGDEQLIELNAKYFPLSNLITRLLNKGYNGKTLKFVNIYFFTRKTYELHPGATQKSTHYYKGNMSFNTDFNVKSFLALPETSRQKFIWEEIGEILKIMARETNNVQLYDSTVVAIIEGINKNLNADFKVLKDSVVLFGRKVDASIWIHFQNDGMYSKFELEYLGVMVFEYDLDKTAHGVEIFLEMYKKIEIKDNVIVIRGISGIDTLPTRIVVNPNIFERINN